MTIKINSFEAENVKRIKAVKIAPSENGITIIGGENEQGKTSVLDALAWALGGERFRPSEPKRDGSSIPPNLHVVMNNGLVVERKGKNSDLKVMDPSGRKGGQQLLNEFIEELALNLPKFMEASGKDKAKTLLQIIGVGEQLSDLEREEKELYQERLYIGRTADQKEKFANEQPYFPDAPEEPVSAAELIREQQEILARNGENQRKRDRACELERLAEQAERELSFAFGQATEAEKRLEEAKAKYNKAMEDKEVAFRTASELQDESTEELEASIANAEEINRKVRANLDKGKAEDDARQYREKYNDLTTQIETVRKEKIALLDSADLPLPELGVEDGELIYRGQKWDNMSGSQRLKVATAIVRKLNPKCGFVLLDKLEQFDLRTLEEFGAWAESEDLQIIATRVSTGDECNILISDGYSYDKDGNRTAETLQDAPRKTWKKGVF